MRKISWLVSLLILVTIIACACSSSNKTSETNGSTNDLSGVYTGTMTFDKINEKFITSYRTPTEKENLKNAANAEVAQSAKSILDNQYKNIVLGAKSSAKSGNFTLNITKNDKSQNIASGDYMFSTIAYNNLLPYTSDGIPYWAMFSDKRNGDMTISVDSKKIQLSNTRKDEATGATYTYKLDGNISGSTIKGTWAQLWEGTEVYSGTFEVKKLGN